MDSRIGRRDGVCRRRSGVAGFMARVAPVSRQAGVHHWGPPRCHMIATLDSPIGWQGGPYLRRHGAARTQERVALRLLEVVPELDLAGSNGGGLSTGACAPSSGARAFFCLSVWLR